MLSQNLLKNQLIDISLYYPEVTSQIFKDGVFLDFIKSIEKDTVPTYKFAIYTDMNLISTNIFIPIFHTLYLGGSRHNVIIRTSNDLLLLETFKNNNYYIIENDSDTFDYRPYNLTKIKNIKDIQQ